MIRTRELGTNDEGSTLVQVELPSGDVVYSLTDAWGEQIRARCDSWSRYGNQAARMPTL